MTADEVSGSQRWIHGPSSRKRDIRRLAYTMRTPIATSTAASPTLNATIRMRPKPTRRIDSALSSTTSAAGQGMMPPLIPSAKSARSDTGSWSWGGRRVVVAVIVPVVVAWSDAWS